MHMMSFNLTDGENWGETPDVGGEIKPRGVFLNMLWDGAQTQVFGFIIHVQ